jgi:hypothetical protein
MVDRHLAIARGLDSIYRVALDSQTFLEHGSDLLWCFYLISSTSADVNLCRAAFEMGNERGLTWKRDHRCLEPDADAETVIDHLYGCSAAEKLGVNCGNLMHEIRRAARRFTAEEFLCFDPTTEPPPNVITERCKCGCANERNRKTCRLCKRRLATLNRFEISFYGLTRSYALDCSNVKIGASYRDVIRWLPLMRPYRDYENGENPDFYDTVYFVTHVVYTLNAYGTYQLSYKWLPEEFHFLKKNLDVAIAMDDPEMVGEFLDSLKAFGLPNENSLIRRGMSYLLSRQNADGSWSEHNSRDKYLRYHPTWTAVDGLRDYAWRGRRLSFPNLGSLVRQSSSKRV